MRRLALHFGGWWGIQFPPDLRSRALWDLAFTEDNFDCSRPGAFSDGVFPDCEVESQSATFNCIGIGTRADGPSTTMRGIEITDPSGRTQAVVPALLNLRQLPETPNWLLFPAYYVWIMSNPLPGPPKHGEATNFEAYPHTWRLSLFSNFFPTGGNLGRTGIQYVDFSRCEPDRAFPTSLAASYAQPSPSGVTSFQARTENLSLSWDPGALTVATDYDIWCEPPLYLFNTTHNYLTGNSTVCVSCPLPYVGRSGTRPDLVPLPDISDPTLYEFLDSCNDICEPGHEPNYYRTGCRPCPENSFSFQGRCEACPTTYGTGLVGVTGDVCTCNPGYIFQPMAPSGTDRLTTAVTPRCVVCPEGQRVNAVANRCDRCPIGQGRAYTPRGDAADVGVRGVP